MKMKVKEKLNLFSVNVVPKYSVSTIALLGLISVSNAQEAIDKPEKKLIEEVEVLGIRLSTKNNITIKRDSNSFVDAITAEDIGQFPDKNVADALQRVPGVTIFRSGGEGSSVSIRGMSPGQTLTQLNGNYLASNAGDPSRSFNFNLLPSTMIERVEVRKSIEARHDEGGVGGSVSIHTRKPLSMDANTFLANVEGTYADVTEDIDPHYSLLYSWKNNDDKFGALIGFTRQERRNRTLSSEAQQWEYWDNEGEHEPVDVNGNPPLPWTSAPTYNGTPSTVDGTTYDQGFWAPRFVRGEVFDERREREGLQVTLEYRPIEVLTLGANYFRFNLGSDSVSNRIDMPEWPLSFINSSLDRLDFVGDPSQPGAILNGVRVVDDASVDDASGDVDRIILPWIRANYNREESISDTFDFFADYQGERFALSFVAGKTKAEGGPTENYDLAYYASNHNDPEDAPIENPSRFAEWTVDGSDFRYNFDPEFYNNLAQGFGGNPDPDSTGSSFSRGMQQETFAQIDLDVDLDFGPITTLHSGVKIRQGEVDRGTYNVYFFREGFGDTDIQNTPNFREYLHTSDNGIHMPNMNAILADQPMDNITGGFSANIFPYIDVFRYRDYLEDNFTKRIHGEPEFVFNIQEDSFAYYLQADFEQGNLRGNIGVRVVESEMTVTSSDQIRRYLDWFDDETGENLIDSGVGLQSETVFNTETVKQTNVLPSFNIAWEPIDNLIFRGAYYETLTRPGFFSLADLGSVRYISPEVVEDRPILAPLEGWYGDGGNKRLKPTRSESIDVGVEWYVGEGTTLGATYFRKEIPNFIATIRRPVERIIDGEEVEFYSYSSPQNASDAGVDGFEVFGTYIHESGFGLSSNYTKLNPEEGDVIQPSTEAEIAEGADPFTKVGEANLSGLSEDAFNFSTFYENTLFSARIAYNYRGKQVGGSSILSNVSDAYDQVDFNATYNVSEQMKATFSVVNLTRSESNSYLGEDTTARFASNAYSGRRVYAGINYRF